MRSQRPPVVASLGRAGTVINGDPRAAQLDEEALRDEHGRLRAMVDNLQRDASEMRDKLKAAERDSSRKDKLLQEILAAATTAKGVPGEALDQIRDDVEVMMNIKRNMQEARKVIEEKEQKIRDLRDVLKATSISEMEDEVEAAKKQAKARASQYAEVRDDVPEDSCIGRSRELRAAAKSHVLSIEQIDTEMSTSLRKMAKLRDEQEKFEKAVEDHGVQAEKLRDKCAEIGKQQEQCQSIIDSLGNVEARHKELKDERDLRAEARPAWQAAQRNADIDPKLSGHIFELGFQPLRADSQGHAWRLLSRFRRTVELGWRSGLEALFAEDGDRDLRISTAEFARGFASLSAKSSGTAASQDLANALHEALYPRLEDLLNVADLVLGMPLQAPPSEPSESEIRAALQSLVWACRRQGRLERDLRSQLIGWLEDHEAEPEAEVAKLCRELGLPNAAEVAGVLSRSLEARQERLAALLPSWRQLSLPSQASVLVHFIHDLTIHRDTVEPLLSSGAMTLESFVEVGLQHFGSRWSRDELEQVALLAECPGGDVGSPPVVDGLRLLRAASPDGLATEFPEMQRHCHHDALRKCEAARKATLRRAAGPASRPGSQPGTPAGGRVGMLTGPGSPLAGAASTLQEEPACSDRGPAAPAAAAAPATVAAASAAPSAAVAASATAAAVAGPTSTSPQAEENYEEEYEEEYEEDLEEDVDEDDDD